MWSGTLPGEDIELGSPFWRKRAFHPDPLTIGMLSSGSKTAQQVRWKAWIRNGSEAHWELLQSLPISPHL